MTKDLLFIINQLFREYKCEHPNLTLYHTMATNLIKRFFMILFFFFFRGNTIKVNDLALHGSRYNMTFNIYGGMRLKLVCEIIHKEFQGLLK